MFVRALKLMFGIREKRFEVVVGGGDAVDEVFEDECEPRYVYMLDIFGFSV